MFSFRVTILAFTCGLTLAAFSQKKPNVIIMVTDDQGFEDLSCYGSKRIASPHLDALAKEGVRFTNYYTASSVCSPSRSAMMTGRYPKRCGVPGVLFPHSKNGLASSEITIAEKLKEAGYATACIGKWHMGHQKEFMPMNQGFEHYYGVPYSNDMSIAREFEIADDVLLVGDCTAEILKSDVARYLKEYRKVRNRVPLLEGNTIVEYPVDQGTLTGKYTARAKAFIRGNKDKPFFLYLPQTMPHTPIFVSEKFAGQSQGGVYGDSIQEIDWAVGEIMEELKAQGLEKDTLFIFCSDNGAAGKGSSLPYKGKKFSTWEGGHRVPMIAWGPGRFASGSTCNEVVTAMDFFPSLLTLVGAEVPTDRVIDGRNILPLFKGKKGAKTPHDTFLYYRANSTTVDGIRQGDWKFVIHGTFPPRKKPEDSTNHLYNLIEDPGEKENLIEKHPEKAAKLKALMHTLDEAIPSPQQ